MKKKRLFFGLFALLVICNILVKKNIKSSSQKILATSGNVSQSINNLSNKKICWGIKRADNHEKPDVGKENEALMEKYNSYYIGNQDKKCVYLTFDAGYEAGYTEKILDVLKQNNVKATFFVTGHYVNSAGDLVRRMIDEGHIVGNHTANHKSMPDISTDTIKEEVMNLHTALYEKFRL